MCCQSHKLCLVINFFDHRSPTPPLGPSIGSAQPQLSTFRARSCTGVGTQRQPIEHMCSRARQPNANLQLRLLLRDKIMRSQMHFFFFVRDVIPRLRHHFQAHGLAQPDLFLTCADQKLQCDLPWLQSRTCANLCTSERLGFSIARPPGFSTTGSLLMTPDAHR